MLALGGCASDASRPDPGDVVEQYLEAIASGDAKAATALDAAAVEQENTASDSDGEAPDLTQLRTDAVLSGADERISDPVVGDDEAEPGAGDDTRRVGFTFMLDGQKHSSSLAVRWDDGAGTWVLQQSFTVKLFVNASQSKAVTELAPFTVAGLDQPIDPDPKTGPLYHLVYPGVYTVTAAFDTSLLDGGHDAMTVTADPTGDATVDFAVTTLPSQAAG